MRKWLKFTILYNENKTKKMIEVIVECKLTGLRGSLVFMNESKFEHLYFNSTAFDNLIVVDIINDQDEENILKQYKELIK